MISSCSSCVWARHNDVRYTIPCPSVPAGREATEPYPARAAREAAERRVEEAAATAAFAWLDPYSIAGSASPGAWAGAGASIRALHRTA